MNAFKAMQEIILYQTEDGKSSIQLRADQKTVWLSQLEIAELFNATKQNISLHLKNILEDGELSPISVVKESLTTAADGKSYQIKLYNLDAILAVGYRVRSPRGVQFRRWASTVLKEFLIKGFTMDDERLKNPDGRPDHFDEMLERTVGGLQIMSPLVTLLGKMDSEFVVPLARQLKRVLIHKVICQSQM